MEGKKFEEQYLILKFTTFAIKLITVWRISFVQIIFGNNIVAELAMMIVEAIRQVAV
jgi:hypothetical protein